jgi:hypothetical protein
MHKHNGGVDMFAWSYNEGGHGRVGHGGHAQPAGEGGGVKAH